MTQKKKMNCNDKASFSLSLTEAKTQAKFVVPGKTGQINLRS